MVATLRRAPARKKTPFRVHADPGSDSFGIVAFLLEMVPFANIAFAFTNTVGAGLWAADLEKGASTAPKLREQAKKAE